MHASLIFYKNMQFKKGSTHRYFVTWESLELGMIGSLTTDAPIECRENCSKVAGFLAGIWKLTSQVVFVINLHQNTQIGETRNLAGVLPTHRSSVICALRLSSRMQERARGWWWFVVLARENDE